jgi:SAM-dependent methyltransferase
MTAVDDAMWNLTPEQWSSVLQSSEDPAVIAARLQKHGMFVPWSQTLVDETADCADTLDLGCGRGEHSAVLARAGRQTTLVDWSQENLDYSQGLYRALNLPGQFRRADITQPLPFESDSVDAVFSCGVFEYFNAAQIDAVMKEAFRVARKRVIIMVPNARAVGYRMGMWYRERRGTWEWGGEVPSSTLKPHFARVGATSFREYSIGGAHSVDFLEALPGGNTMIRVLTRLLRLTRHSRPARFAQGYLLVSIGEKPQRGSVHGGG